MKIRFKDLDNTIVFAKNDLGELVFIDDVENGYSCNCFCINCGGKLNAKNGGAINAHHFAHAQGSDCKKGHENTIPLFVKRILENKKFFICPNGQVKLKGKYLNPSQKISISNIELIKNNNYPPVVLVSTSKGRQIGIYTTLLDNKPQIGELSFLESFENLIHIDIRALRGSALEVEPTLEKILLHPNINIHWKKRYDEKDIIDRIKNLSERKSFGYDSNYIEHFYCPLEKINTDSKFCKCNDCHYYVNNIIPGFDTKGCLGFISGDLTVETIMKASKPDFSQIVGPSFKELNADYRQGYYWLKLSDLNKAYTDLSFCLIYDCLTNRVFMTNLKYFSMNLYIGLDVDFNGNLGNTIEYLRDYSNERSWRICSLKDYKINNEDINRFINLAKCFVS